MTQISLAKDYDAAYEALNRIPQQNDSAEVDFFAALVDDRPPARILDLGCAEGQLSVRLASRGHRVVAADISAQFLEKTARLAAERGVAVETVQLDIEKGAGSLRGEQFDVIYLMDVIEHFRDPIAGLGHIREILKDDGLFIIHTPNAVAIGRLWWALKNRRSLIDYSHFANLTDLHFQTYDYLTLEKTLNFVGFRVMELVPTRATPPAPWWLKRRTGGLQKRISAAFPHFSDTLLVKCRKTDPIDVSDLIAYWEARGRAGFH